MHLPMNCHKTLLVKIFVFSYLFVFLFLFFHMYFMFTLFGESCFYLEGVLYREFKERCHQPTSSAHELLTCELPQASSSGKLVIFLFFQVFFFSGNVK